MFQSQYAELIWLEITEARVKKSKSSNQHDEEKLLKDVMKLSEEEYKKEKDKKKEIERMEKTLALSSKEESERWWNIFMSCFLDLYNIFNQ